MNKIYSKKPFLLECGEKLEQLEISFSTYGELTENSNIIWVCHALTANSEVKNWWPGLFGDNRAFDPKTDFIICVNNLGSCYGTSGPITPLRNKRPLLDQFPLITIRDQVAVNELVRKHLRINKIDLLVGASQGGQIALEWSIQKPELVKKQVLIATNARHSAYGIAFNESQRLALLADSTFGNGLISGGRAGLIAARSIALLSYRSYQGYTQTQTNPGDYQYDDFLASQYQLYQGKKLADRFSAYSYYTLSKAMDSHNVGRNRNSIEEALASIETESLIIGIQSDVLFPVEEQKFLANNLKNAAIEVIESDFGHDGFLIETGILNRLILEFKLDLYKITLPTVFKKNLTITEHTFNN